MNPARPDRRRVLAAAAAGAAYPALVAQPAQAARPTDEPFGYCLNTSTVRDNGRNRPILQLVEIAAKAGYQAIEPWIAELDAYQREGGSLKDLGKRIADAGLVVPSAIGFAEWIVDDDARRKKALEGAKRDMDWVRQIGGVRIAAPPLGATGGTSQRDDPNASKPVVDLMAAADRYRALLDLGKSMDVTPMVEVWGFSKTLRRLGEAWLVAAECGKAGGCVLPDVYHLYKGGSDFAGLRLLAPAAVGIFHVNDYPDRDRGRITDADRVFPGDGVAPLADVYRALRAVGYRGFLSLELFNKDYWKRDGLAVAREGLEKLKASVRKAAG
jgi:sugar phosphate isomerase/epimerase